MTMTEATIKENVRQRYTEAVTKRSSCCGGGTATTDGKIPAGRVAELAGYGEDELKAIPAAAVESSFGCGNPLAFAGVQAGQVVLDIGSGAGIDCFLAARKVGPTGRVIGIDMTPAMIEKARENARSAGITNVEFRLGEAESMPAEDGIADWIISNCVINLSPDKPRVFREAYRVLKPGGRLSVSDIMVEELPPFMRESAALYASCVSGAIPEKEYLQGLRDAGFSKVEVTERIVYDRDMLLGLISDPAIQKVSCCTPAGGWTEILDRYILGKIWSAKVVAEK